MRKEAWYCPECRTIGAHAILERHADAKKSTCTGVPIRARMQDLSFTVMKVDASDNPVIVTLPDEGGTVFTEHEMELLRALVEATYKLPIGLPYSSKIFSVGQAVIDSMWTKLAGPVSTARFGPAARCAPVVAKDDPTRSLPAMTRIAIKLTDELRERAARKNRSGDVGYALALALSETADAISSVVAEASDYEADDK